MILLDHYYRDNEDWPDWKEYVEEVTGCRVQWNEANTSELAYECGIMTEDNFVDFMNKISDAYCDGYEIEYNGKDLILTPKEAI
jgi:hypothetical protein